MAATERLLLSAGLLLHERRAAAAAFIALTQLAMAERAAAEIRERMEARGRMLLSTRGAAAVLVLALLVLRELAGMGLRAWLF